MNKQELQAVIVAAMKAKDTVKLSAARMIMSDIQKREATTGKDITPKAMREIIESNIKKIDDVLAYPLDAEKRLTLIDERGVYADLLPPEEATTEPSSAEVESRLKVFLTENSITNKNDFGKVMGWVKTTDMNPAVASPILKTLLK